MTRSLTPGVAAVNLVELRRGGATPRLGGWGGRWDRVEGLPHSRAERRGVCGWWFLTLKVPGRVVCSCAQPRRGRLGLCLRHEVSGTHPTPKMPPRKGGEILSWPSGPCSGTAVRNRGAARDPARDRLKGEEEWRTRLPGLPSQPLRCNLPAFGLGHHHHHFPGPGQCVCGAAAHVCGPTACHGRIVYAEASLRFTVFASEEVPGRRRRLRRSARLCRPDSRSDRKERSTGPEGSF